MSGVGHNGGPTLEPGHRWRAYQWRKAQKALMPNTIPLVVLRMRMRRATELGMDYKAYAAIRQATGRDVCGLLFSSNALRIVAGSSAMPRERHARLGAVRGADRLGAVHAPVRIGDVLQTGLIEAAIRAPTLRDPWRETGRILRDFLHSRKLAGDQVVIVGDTALEAEWLGAARAAGYLAADRYFEATR